MSTIAFYEGKFVDENDINISVRSKAFNYGLGCFEGIRGYYNKEEDQVYIFKLREHYKRFLQSCKTLNIQLPYTLDELCDATVELVKRNNFKCNVYLRPLGYKDSNKLSPSLVDNSCDRLVIYAMELNSYAGKETLDTMVSSWTRVHDNMIPPRAKTTAAYLNSALANLEAVQNGFDEAIFLTSEGYVSEGPGENIFLVRDGKVITPAASESLLEGITRALVIELAKNAGIEVVERRVSRTELYCADEVFFSGTAMEITPVVSVDRKPVGDGKVGPIYWKIKEQFNGLTIGKNPKYVDSCTKVY
ncbi:branched-chain amino acid transaminase [Clostridium cellulovorans]|uniref:Branched-chain-amino-acid aminotransferase n=1 Tax=Clostridium cellulovorans (strain ATCC 35296 / DSM 3052 / OCM 3 / 743B) TaxID=573061 RepID=D9SVF5_CLOC7|nr:branched-chain amino acid transaminase [Clostridium cellulovorans]ADL51079.1 branched-chain amino acid aminotransferase [Clostridium cellulovorans 743B]